MHPKIHYTVQCGYKVIRRMWIAVHAWYQCGGAESSIAAPVLVLGTGAGSGCRLLL